MALTGPTGPLMNRDEADRLLVRLSAERDAVEHSLLALQDHQGRRLLEGARLTGLTAERWAAAEPGYALLWSLFDTYAEALAAARAVRSRRNRLGAAELAQLTELLRGNGVVLSAGQLAPPEPGSAAAGAAGLAGLAAVPKLTERVSLAVLLDRMNDCYLRVVEVAEGADAVWSALPARIDLLAAELGRVRALARSVGVLPGEHPAADALEDLVKELGALRADVVGDPLAFWQPQVAAAPAAAATGAGAGPAGTGSAGSGSGPSARTGRRMGDDTPAGGTPAPRRAGTPVGGGLVDTGRYDRAARAVDGIRTELEDLLRLRDDADERLERVARTLSRADATLAEARRARGEVLAKIAATEVPAVPGPATAMRERLAQADQLRQHGQWHRLGPLLDTLEAAAQRELLRARESLGEVTAPLAVRAELRGRLDAYKVMAARYRLGEDRVLLDLYDQARRLLWSAPCDLRTAEYAVDRYQQAIRAAARPPAEPDHDGGRADAGG